MTESNDCRGGCVMCRAEDKWKEPSQPLLESVIGGAGIMSIMWLSAYFFWAIGELVARAGLGLTSFLVMLGVGALAGLWILNDRPTMNDDYIDEAVMAAVMRHMWKFNMLGVGGLSEVGLEEAASEVILALHTEGYRIYRPKDCDRIVWHVVHPTPEDRTFRLVPVEVGA